MDTLHLPPPPQPIHLPTHSPPNPITSCWDLAKFQPGQKSCYPSGGKHTFHTPHLGGTFLAQAQGTERTSWISCCALGRLQNLWIPFLVQLNFCWLDLLPAFHMLVLIYRNNTLVNMYMYDKYTSECHCNSKHIQDTLVNITAAEREHMVKGYSLTWVVFSHTWCS